MMMIVIMTSFYISPASHSGFCLFLLDHIGARTKVFVVVVVGLIDSKAINDGNLCNDLASR